jgi:hypothetical protein
MIEDNMQSATSVAIPDTGIAEAPVPTLAAVDVAFNDSKLVSRIQENYVVVHTTS